MAEQANGVGKGVRRVGHDQHDRLRRGGVHPRHDVLVGRDIAVEQPQPARRVVAVGGAAGLLVDPGRDHHQCRAGEVVVVAVAQGDRGREHGAILGVGHQPLRAFPVAVDDDDLARAAPRDQCREARRSDRPRADNPDLHPPLLPRAGRDAASPRPG